MKEKIHQTIPDIDDTLPRPNYVDNGFIGNSFRVLIDDLNRQAYRARRRFKKDGELWRLHQGGINYYADAITEAVLLLERRLRALPQVGSGNPSADRSAK